MNKFRVGEFALLQGQLVEILEILEGRNRKYWPDDFFYKVKLAHDTLTHRVHELRLNKLSGQVAPKVLYGSK